MPRLDAAEAEAQAREKKPSARCNIGALIARMGLGGPLYYKIKNKEPPPKNSIGNHLGKYLNKATGA